MSIFPGAVCCWCLSFGRFLVKQSARPLPEAPARTRSASSRGTPGSAATASRSRCSADKLQKGDVIVVHTGEVVPVDGHVVEGMAMIDQHALTGESTPAEKGVGDRVFASTLLVAGKVTGHGRDVGQRDGLGQDQPDPQRHGGVQAGLAAQGGAAGRQGRDPDPGRRRRRPGHDGPHRRGGGAQQRPRHRHPHGRAAGDAQLAGPLRQQGHPGQGRPGPGADEPGRHRPVRQDRHPDPRAARGRPDHRGPTAGTRSRSSGSRRPPSGSSTTRSPWPSCTRPRSWGSPCRRPTTRSTRSATASRSTSRGTPSASAASGSWSRRASS